MDEKKEEAAGGEGARARGRGSAEGGTPVAAGGPRTRGHVPRRAARGGAAAMDDGAVERGREKGRQQAKGA